VHVTPEPRPHLASFVHDFLRYGDQTSVVYREGLRTFRVSYRDLAQTAARFAAELEGRQIVKGDRVLIWGENNASWIAAFFGCLLRGVIAVPLDVTGSPEFAHRIVNEVAPKLCTGSAPQLAQLPPELPRIAFEEFENTLSNNSDPRPIEGLKDSDPFQIVFTSGTTGDPKGVVHTHRNVLASLGPIEHGIQEYRMYERIFHPLRFLHTLPLSHVFGQFMGIWIPALLAAEVHFESRLIAAGLIEQIGRSRISVVAAVPRVLDILRSHLLAKFPGFQERVQAAEGAPVWKRWWLFHDIHHLFGLKFWAFLCGGATLPPDLEKFWTTLGFAVVQGYGMTETAALVSLNHPFRQARGSIGKVLPGREIQLRDDGEILVRGETVSNATWEGGRLHQRDSEWLATGDLASIDKEGNLQYRGRKKDVIVTSSGLNIYPEDLETALQRQPAVRSCAVIEVQGPTGPAPLAALVLRDRADPVDVIRAANRDLAEYQQIRQWFVWPEPDLPRTSTGKILRREVARVVLSSRAGTEAPSAAAGTLAGILQEITGEDISKRTDETQLSEDLHLDSLGRVELQSNLETSFGLHIDDAEWQRVRTLGDLRSLLRPQPAAASQRDQPPAPRTGEHHYLQWPWAWPQQLIRGIFIQTVMRPLVWLLAAPRVESQLRQDPPKRVLIVANHVTAYDGPLILYALPRGMRTHVAIAMGGELLLDMRKGRNLGSRLLNLVAPAGYLLATALFNVFPLPQKSGFRESFEHAGQAMDRGYNVLVFPEGRRSPDGEVHSFQSGAGLLWKDLGAPALPVYLAGLGELKQQRARWFRSGRIEVRVGELVQFDPSLDAAQATRVLEKEIEKLRQLSSSTTSML
jgi:long-chain acyl-CoA synthetase